MIRISFVFIVGILLCSCSSLQAREEIQLKKRSSAPLSHDSLVDVLKSAVPKKNAKDKIEGFEIVRGADLSFLKELKVEPGDILIESDGIALDSPKAYMDLMTVKISKSKPFSLSLIRGGKKKTYYYRFF